MAILNKKQQDFILTHFTEGYFDASVAKELCKSRNVDGIVEVLTEYQEALIERMDDANEIQMRHLNKLLEQTEELIDQLLG